VCFDLGGEERRAEKVFQHVDDAVQEFEDLEGFRVGGGGTEEEELVLYNGVEKRWGVRVWEVD
jgi:hypothetical protein